MHRSSTHAAALAVFLAGIALAAPAWPAEETPAPAVRSAPAAETPAPAASAEDAKESAAAAHRSLCPVCNVKEGTTEAEPVRATRVYEGRTYGFCSDKCANEFDRDPKRYAQALLEAPADSTLRAPLFTRISSAPT